MFYLYERMDGAGQSETRIEDQIAEFRPRLYAFAYSLTRDHEQASDLAQETCARALGAADRFEPGSNLRAWLFTILHNAHLNRHRAARNRPVLVPIEELDPERQQLDGPLSEVEHQAILRAEVSEVMQALDGVPEVFAAPLRMVAIGQLSYAEVGRVLDIPIGTVMSRVHRARRLLLSTLSEDDVDPGL